MNVVAGMNPRTWASKQATTETRQPLTHFSKVFEESLWWLVPWPLSSLKPCGLVARVHCCQWTLRRCLSVCPPLHVEWDGSSCRGVLAQCSYPSCLCYVEHPWFNRLWKDWGWCQRSKESPLFSKQRRCWVVQGELTPCHPGGFFHLKGQARDIVSTIRGGRRQCLLSSIPPYRYNTQKIIHSLHPMEADTTLQSEAGRGAAVNTEPFNKMI